MDNSATSLDQDDAARRRSGRVSKAPQKFEPELSQSAKRKRGQGQDGGFDDGDLDSEEDDSSEEEDDSDEEHPAPRSRQPANRRKKPSTKKPKINGAAVRIPSRPKKAVRIEVGEKGTGLFGKSK